MFKIKLTLIIVILLNCDKFILINSEFFQPNTPPVFDFDREWIISQNESIGSKISSVKIKNIENIIYGIEPSVYFDGSKFFEINSKTGDVYLKKSLNGKAGNDYYIFITGNNGYQKAKVEVLVRIVNSDTRFNLRPIPAYTVKSGLALPGLPARPDFLHKKPKEIQIIFNNTKATPLLKKFYPILETPLKSKLDIFTFTQKPTIMPLGNKSSSEEAGHVYNLSSSLELLKKGLKNFDNSEDGGIGSNISHLDLIALFVPLLGAMAFAPFAGLVFFILYRRWAKKLKLDSSWSLKDKIINTKFYSKKSKSNETSFRSLSYNSDYNSQFISFYSTDLFQKSYNRDHDQDSGTGSKEDDFNSSSNFEKWEFPREKLRILGLLGEGCFGRVWKCEAYDIMNCEGTTIVAIKTIKESASEQEKKDLITELEILKKLEPHPNVVQLMGCCIKVEPKFLILEYVPFGTLQTYLRESRSERYYGNILGAITAKDLISFAYQIAKGMSHIASQGIIHRDLAARNVLMSANKTCKITDFGFSRDINSKVVYERKSEGRLPIRWMSPESLYDNIFTTKADVWSFGILMWEIVTLGSTPYPGLNTKQVMKKVVAGYRLEKPDHCKREMYNIMFYCWHKDFKKRPNFSELVTMLDKLLLSQMDYIELDRFPDHCYYNVVDNISGEKL